MKIILFLSITLIFSNGLMAQSIRIYDPPGGYKYSSHNDDFTVQVRIPGQQWQDLFEYAVDVDLDTKSKATMVFFDCRGAVEVRVKLNNGMIHKARIRPEQLPVKPDVNGNIVQFTLHKPTKLSLEINGDRLHNLHVFANEWEEHRPDPDDPNVMYFGPGIHEAPDKPGDVIHVYSGKTVYIAGGAIVKAKFLIDHAHDVKLLGRGIIMQSERGIEIRHSSNVTVEGLTILDPRHYTVYAGASRDITIRNIKSFSSRGWSDGIDLMSCNDVWIQDIFMRNSDDCIAIYGHRWDFYGSASNIHVSDAILWADVAHPINIGLHGDAENGGDTIDYLSFTDIDILEQDEDDRNYQGCLSIVASDNNLIRHVTFENVRIDDIQEGQLFQIKVVKNEKYSHAPGRGIRDVQFKNITYNGAAINRSEICGYDAARCITDIIFDELIINGEKVRDKKSPFIQIGNDVQGISFQ